MADVGRFVRFAAFGDGGEEGGVGFHQHSVERDVLCGFLNALGVFEGNDAGEGNVEAQIQGQSGHAHVFGETVDDAAVRAVFAQHPHGVVGRVAGVDDERQAAFVGGEDVVGEAAVLPCQIAFAPVVVEAGFADGDDFGVAGVCHEFVRAEFFRFRVVGMDADAGVDVRVLFGDGQNLVEALPADADGEGV